MKKLTENDIYNMLNNDFVPNNDFVRRSVRKELRLSVRVPQENLEIPEYSRLDLHQLTEEQAWNKIMELAQSGVRNATIITGASGILKVKFIQWVKDSLLTEYVNSVVPINNGSFSVKFNKNKMTF